MSAFDTLEQQLRDSARRRYRPRLARRLAPAVALAVAALTVFAVAREDRTPVGADEREAPAAQPAPTWTPQLGDDDRGHPSIARSPVPPAQAKAFAILRRPQTDADRSPRVQALLKLLSPQTMSGIRVDAIRLLERRGDEITILLPIRRLRGNPHDPADDELDALCFMQGGPRSSGGSCTPSADAVRGRMRMPIPPRGLAPDGAARVTVRVRGGRTIAVDVRDNYFDARWVGEDAAVGIAMPRYFDAQGHEIHFR